MFEHEKLRVYHAAQKHLVELKKMKEHVKQGHSKLLSHIFESAESISLNISEGCGDGRPGKKANYFRIASGSTGECRGGISSLLSERAVARKYTYASADLCDCIRKMLKPMIIYYERLD